MKTCKLLFQGDSITDSGRIREEQFNLGTGYPKYASALLRERYPDIQFTFLNRGIGCDETAQLLARIEPDLIELHPDIVSILIGINDTWHHAEAKDWMPLGLFEERYRRILERVKNETNARIMVIEQYLFPVPDKSYFMSDLQPKQNVVRKLAEEYADVFLPLQRYAEEASQEKGSGYFTPDGVHLNEKGAMWLGEIYARAVERLILSR